ncbi:hypothetical protein FRC07_008591 [Ceratobasidium sp. 392]|nr:hypothetical protein FRC07_008591 [Ceratobasidium sp. 392]
MLLLIKNICKLEELLETICVIRRVLLFFGKSVHASALLEECWKLLKILRGLQAIVDTWFGTVVIAAKSLLQCMPAIQELVVEEAIAIPEHNNLFMGSSPASIMFEMQLTVLIAVLDPILRGLTCLESLFSTPANVLLIFSVVLMRVDKHLRSGLHGISKPGTINTIRKCSSGRFSELINESPDDVYVTAFWLDPLYRDTRLLRDIDPFTIKITLNASDDFTSHAPTLKMIRRIGKCLFTLLRATYPFSEKIGKNMLAYQWWELLQKNPASNLLAYLARKPFSITPNSMADKRMVSTFGWLNSVLRSRQDVPTVVRQTQIRQFYAWDKSKHAAKQTQICYRDLQSICSSEKTKSALSNSGSPQDDSKSYKDNFQTKYSEHGNAWLDEPDLDGPKVNAKLIEASSLVNLDAPEVEDCLSNEAPAGLKNRRKALNGSNKKVAVQQDEALTEEDWDF